MPIGCIICKQPFASADRPPHCALALNRCGHVFHEDCLKNHLKVIGEYPLKCPTCKRIASLGYLETVRMKFLEPQRTVVDGVKDMEETIIDPTLAQSSNAAETKATKVMLATKEMLEAKDREIEQWRKSLAEKRALTKKIERDFLAFKSIFDVIGNELNKTLPKEDDSLSLALAGLGITHKNAHVGQYFNAFTSNFFNKILNCLVF